MAKEIPKHIKVLIEKKETLRSRKNILEEELKTTEKEWHMTHEIIQDECTHKFEDGTTAWDHRYAYSFCRICNYDDL